MVGKQIADASSRSLPDGFTRVKWERLQEGGASSKCINAVMFPTHAPDPLAACDHRRRASPLGRETASAATGVPWRWHRALVLSCRRGSGSIAWQYRKPIQTDTCCAISFSDSSTSTSFSTPLRNVIPATPRWGTGSSRSSRRRPLRTMASTTRSRRRPRTYQSRSPQLRPVATGSREPVSLGIAGSG